jgi:hypothetical protein
MMPELVIPAKAGIQKNPGFRIKSGMTDLIRLTLVTLLITFMVSFLEAAAILYRKGFEESSP